MNAINLEDRKVRQERVAEWERKLSNNARRFPRMKTLKLGLAGEKRQGRTEEE